MTYSNFISILVTSRGNISMLIPEVCQHEINFFLIFFMFNSFLCKFIHKQKVWIYYITVLRFLIIYCQIFIKQTLINNTPVQNTKLKSYVIIKKKLTINKYHKIRQVQTQGLYICIGGFMKKFRKPCSIVKDPGE